MTTHLWLTTALAAERAAHHPTTVRQAAEAGILHGYQRVTGGRWKFRPECVDAWVAGESCEHKSKAA